MGIMAEKMERNVNAAEMSDQDVLNMLARIFGVGDEEELATAYSAH